MYPALRFQETMMKAMLKGDVRCYAACDTMQVGDYSRYSLGAFSEETKKAHHDEQFPVDLKEAFRMGAEMSEKR